MAENLTYAELHCHSAYSLREGASMPEELVQRARELGYAALALTDHDGLYGAMEFAQHARAWGIRPITGAEVTLTTGGHLTLLCATREGYGNLCRLLTAAHARGKDDPAVAPDVLAAHAGGLLALTGCPRGEVPSLLSDGREEDAEAALRRLLAWFGPGNVYAELQRHYVRGEAARNRRLVALARRLGVPVVATNNVHYHARDRHRLQDVLVAIRHRTTLDGCHRERRPNDEYFLKAPQEMAHLFRDLPEAVGETVRVAERCTFDLARDLGYRFPDFRNERGEPADAALARVCREALDVKYGPLEPTRRQQAAARLEEELALVRRHGLSGFFLVYRDLLELATEVAREVRGPGSARARANLPPGRGRGSSVSSIICYLIGLSHVDPVRHNLSLGRFLNEEMASVPDIDLDFPRDIREVLIRRVMERYGHEHAALVCTFATYRYRSAVRDVGKALGLPEADLDRLAKLGDGWGAGDVAAELARAPELAAKAAAPAWRHLAELAGEIAGLPRHVSQHVGGMVIASQPLVELVPVEPARMAGRFVVQWDKDSCDDARFIKVDFLALGMLSAVEECLELVAAGGKPPVDLARLDYEDAAVYDEICRGDTIGLFQVESRAQIQMLPRVRPRTLDDLAVQVAIVRPGPIVGGAVHPYVTRRAQELRWRARYPDRPFRPPVDHPSLAPVLGETLGVILFQDQVLAVARALAGFTAGQAESLRRAMSRRRSRELMLTFWRAFRDGCARNGVGPGTARTVFRKLVAFSEFGFPKSHAAAFAVLAYQSAWLRRHHPAEFSCALLNQQPMGFYPPHVLVGDLRRRGVRVLRPDVNRSGAACTVEDGAVRLGLAFVAGLGKQAAGAVAAERARGGPYRSLPDLLRRAPGLRREAAEHLILAGACDGFGLARRELLWQLGLVLRPRGRQLALPLPTGQDQVRLPEETAWDRLTWDYTLLSLSPDAHPLAHLRRALGEGVVGTRQLGSLPAGLEVQVAGLVVCRQRPGTAKGFVFLLLEDEWGLANVVVHPELYARRREVVRLAPFLLVRGRLERRDGVTNVIARELADLSRPAERAGLDLPPGETPPATPLAALAPPAHNFG